MFKNITYHFDPASNRCHVMHPIQRENDMTSLSKSMFYQRKEIK